MRNLPKAEKANNDDVATSDKEYRLERHIYYYSLVVYFSWVILWFWIFQHLNGEQGILMQSLFSCIVNIEKGNIVNIGKNRKHCKNL